MATLNVPPSLAAIATGNGFRFLPKNTRRIYDVLAEVYPISTLLFHSDAHKVALSLAGVTDGMREYASTKAMLPNLDLDTKKGIEGQDLPISRVEDLIKKRGGSCPNNSTWCFKKNDLLQR